MTELGKRELGQVARVLGQAYGRNTILKSHDGKLTPELREQIKADWEANKKDYISMGRTVLRHLNKLGYTVAKSPSSDRSDEPAT